eukprot:16319576-Heterocapsa_arctica.AAC.1
MHLVGEAEASPFAFALDRVGRQLVEHGLPDEGDSVVEALLMGEDDGPEAVFLVLKAGDHRFEDVSFMDHSRFTLQTVGRDLGVLCLRGLQLRREVLQLLLEGLHL